MRTSDKILRQVRRALIAVFILSGLASLVLAVLALHAIPLLALDFAVPRSEQLWLLAASASAAALALLCIDAARERILQRAGLWLDHTLAQHTLLNGSRQAAPLNALKSDAAAIARVRDALLDRAAMPALEAPWALALIAVLVLLHPLLGAIGALAMALLLLVVIVQAAPVTRLDQQRLRAADRVSAWWHGLPAAPLTVESAQHWERVNTPHVAAAYMLDRRVLLLRDLARIVRVVALLAAIGLGVWLVSRQDLTLGALVAGLLLLARLLLPFERLLAGLRQVRRAMLDYRRLASRPEPPRCASRLCHGRREPSADAGVHRADPAPAHWRTAGAGLRRGAAAVRRWLRRRHVAAAAADCGPDRRRAIGVAGGCSPSCQRWRGGTPARGAWRRGQGRRRAGQPGYHRARPPDRRPCRNEAEVARKELDVVGREATALAALSPATIADRVRLRALEERIGELHQRADSLLARTTAAELDLARSVIRAPVSGHVVSLGVSAPNDTIDPGATVAEIVTGERRDLADRTAEPLLRTMHRMLRSLYQENAA